MPRPRRSRRAAVATTAPTNPEPTNDVAHPSTSDVENPTNPRLGRSRKDQARGRTTSIDGIASQAEKKALARASKDRDVAMRRLSMEDVTTSSSTVNDATVAATLRATRKHDDDRYDSSVEFGRKAAATPVHAHRHDTTGLELDDDVFDALDDSLDMDDEDDLQLHLEAPASGQRSADTSGLTASILKRRAPSISLHGNDSAPIRPSSRAGATTPLVSSSFNIGVFQRRAREPSILGTAQKESARKAVEVSSDAASSDEEEVGAEDEKSMGTSLDGGNISPQVEQTPSARRKTRTRSAVGGQPDEAEPQASSSAKSRKRKSIEADEADEASERPQKASRADHQSELEEVDADVDTGADAAPAAEEDAALSDSSSLSSLPSPELPPLRAPRPSTPINQSDIMAPPESSSSEAEDARPDMRSDVPGGAGKRRRNHGRPTTPVHAGNVSDVSSPPSLTHSPNYAPARRSRRQQQRGEEEHQRKSGKQVSEQITTADLAGLLPRRRHRNPAAAEEEHPSSDAALDASGLGRDQDELSYLDARARRRRGRTTPGERRGGGGGGGGGGSDNAGGAGTTKTKGKGGSSSRPASGRTSRTYGRRSSDKENQSGNDGEGDGSFSPAPDDTFDATGEEGTGDVAEELRNAVQKFQEVDRWQMEFEEMTQSSSPVGGR